MPDESRGTGFPDFEAMVRAISVPPQRSGQVEKGSRKISGISSPGLSNSGAICDACGTNDYGTS